MTIVNSDRKNDRKPPNQDNPFLNPDYGLMLKERPKLKKPSMYQVIIFNDDYTPMEFVVEILEGIFRMDRPKATKIMLAIHTQGKAVCGIYTHDVATTKARQVVEFAKHNEHPLMCEIEACNDSDK